MSTDEEKSTPPQTPESRSLGGARVLLSRTGIAVYSFVVMGVSLYVGHSLYTGKSLKMPRPKYFASAEERGGRAGPLPTAAERKYKPPPQVKFTVQPIEEPPKGRGLAPFFRALRRTDDKRPGAITRVSHWGDSQIVADNITFAIRRALQKRFGDAGHGFLGVGQPNGYRHKDVWHWSNTKWSFAGVAQGYRKDHYYGLATLHATTSKYGAIAKYVTKPDQVVGQRVSRFEISYLEHKLGGRFQVQVDDGRTQTVNTRRTEGKREAVLRLKVPDGPHKLALLGVGFGTLRLFGVVLERDVPGVVYDSLGLKGAQLRDLARIDAAHWERQLKWRRPNLVVFGFGTNESYQRIPIPSYAPDWRTVIRRAKKALPQSSCLVLGPVDRVYQRQYSHPRTKPLRDLMREVALSEGCAFWDTFKAMGGKGAAMRWRQADLMWGDLAHLSPKGGAKLGGLIAKALMERYEAWLRQTRIDEAKARRKQPAAPTAKPR